MLNYVLSLSFPFSFSVRRRYAQGPVGSDSALMAEELIIHCTRYEESTSTLFTRGKMPH